MTIQIIRDHDLLRTVLGTLRLAELVQWVGLLKDDTQMEF